MSKVIGIDLGTTNPFSSLVIESVNVKIDPVPPVEDSNISFHSAGIEQASQ